MLPASNAGVGGNAGFPDTCLTQIGPAPVPIPYPNVALNAQSVGFCPNVMVTSVPLNNMGTQQSMTSGMEVGAVHPAGTKKPGGPLMGNPMIQANGLPASNLLMPTQGNSFNNPAGANVIPSVVNVMFCSSAAGALVEPPTEDVASGEVQHGADRWDRPLTHDETDALQALAGEVDDHTTGFTPAISRDPATGKWRMTVVHVRPRTLALAAGLEPDDEIVAVNGRLVADAAAAAELADLLMCAEGTTVTFTINRAGQLHALRATCPGPERRAAIGHADVADGLGRIDILRFQPDLPRQVVIEILRLTAAGATRLEFDLRNCPGGDLDAALRLADMLLPAGLDLVSVGRADGDCELHRSRHGQRFDHPLTLLVNGQTASAAEVFAGCLQQHRRADLVGSPTMGKWSVQVVDVGAACVRTTAVIRLAAAEHDPRRGLDVSNPG